MQIDPRLIEACIRIRNVPDLNAFVKFLDARHKEEMNLLSTLPEDKTFRLGQGKVQAFKEILDLLDGAPALLEKVRNKS